MAQSSLIFPYDNNNHVKSSQFWFMETLFQTENAQKWFTVSFFWGHLGIVKLDQGHTSWLFWQGGTVGNRTLNLWLWGQIAKPLSREPTSLPSWGSSTIRGYDQKTLHRVLTSTAFLLSALCLKTKMLQYFGHFISWLQKTFPVLCNNVRWRTLEY